MENKESNWKGSPYREIFENNLRQINDRESINNLIMVWVDQSVNEHNAELLERYKRMEEALKGVDRLYSDVEHMVDGEVREMLNEVRQALNTNTNK